VGGSAQHLIVPKRAQRKKNTPEIFVNMKIIVDILKFLNKIYVSEYIIAPAINFMASTAGIIRKFKMATIIFMYAASDP
jgi:hypothetical protein